MEQALNFNGKKIYIAPHTPKTTMFQKELAELHDVEVLGYVDNFQKAHDICKPKDIKKKYDFILILSENHGNTIYKDFSLKLPKHKLLKVEMHNGSYKFLNQKEIKENLAKDRIIKYKQNFLQITTKIWDFLNLKRDKIVFISKGSITSNNKALFIHCIRENMNVYMLTDNKEQFDELKKLNLPVVMLESLYAYFLISQAKITVQDQANLTKEINLLSPQQKSLQMWHGIPLKRLNKLTTVSYDYLISTSNFVNKTTLSKVIEAKEYKDYGYPRNDLFMKDEHDKYDLLFCDNKIYQFAKDNFGTEHKIALYMPTHRESNKAAKIPLDFKKLNIHLKENNITLILKLHHFVQNLYKEEKSYSNILFHTTQGDVYPLLKYTDILITDYSSVFFDFLLLDRPIIFFDYDKEEYEENMQGFLYDYENYTPGIKVTTQETLIESMQQIISNNEKYYKQRSIICNLFYAYKNANSANRIIKDLLL